jgi:Fe-Mn family superoxide dismutase
MYTTMVTKPELGYAFDALEPYFDAETMELHSSKHHQAYTDKYNAAVAKYPEFADKCAGCLLKNLDNVPEDIRAAVRNHGGGFVNHNMFFSTLKKDVAAEGPVVDAIAEAFGSLDSFKEQFTAAAMGQFGSGWAWLVVDKETKALEIISTANQDSPLSLGKKPLLGVDVWEHSYYKKFGPARAEYVAAFFSVLNWDVVNKRFEKSCGC